MITLGIIVGNRGFFPAHLCDTGRKEILATLEKLGIGVVALPVNATKFGAVESMEDAQKCADLFKQNAGKIDGILVTLPNFGDERGVANALRWSGLRVPVLDPRLQRRSADHDHQGPAGQFLRQDVRLQQPPAIPAFPSPSPACTPAPPTARVCAQDLQDFVVTCRVIKALKNLRIGALGARPTAFNTVRYSEKLLEQSGISIETLDLYELFGWVGKLKDSDAAVEAKLKEIQNYVAAKSIPPVALLKMAKFGVAVDRG